MTNLPQAPLVYTLGVVHFPAVPEIDRFVPRFHDAVRERYPILSSMQMAQANVQMSSDGLKVDQSIAPLWQFASPDRRWGFVLSPQVLALHTVGYESHGSFAEAFAWGLRALVEVPDVKLAYAEAVGIRYVNRIVPQEGEDLRDYLKTSVLPPAFEEVEGLDLAEAVYVSRYVTEEGEMRFQVLLNPPSVLPLELETPLVRENGWTVDRPERAFAVVDTDYGTRFPSLKVMDVGGMKDHMLRLIFVAKAVFEGMATDYAKRVWKGETA